MIGKKLIVILFSILIIVTSFSQTIVSSNTEDEIDKKLDPGYGGMIIGRIKNLNRFGNLEYITCQAVHVYYNIMWLPPHYPYSESGWLDSGEIVIVKPYIGIVLRNFIFVTITDFYIPM